MSIARKVLGVAGIMLASIMIAAAITLLCAPDDDRAEMLEVFTPENVQEESPRQVDWDSLPPEVIVWVEVPGTESTNR